jgi:hypothetical protein
MRMFFVWLAAAALAAAQDPHCSAYPPNLRSEWRQSLELDYQAMQHAARVRGLSPGPHADAGTMPRANFIDNVVFDRMAADRVPAAPLTTDEEFLRRVFIDLTGRIPAPERVKQFAADTRGNKRALLIEELLASPAYVDQWTLYFAGRFQVTSGFYGYIGIPGRNAFHRYLREYVQRDRSYRDFVSELITATGDAEQNPAAYFLIRGWSEGDPIQDTYDWLSDRLTSRFLGIRTECISCHDGRYHLEQINVHLSKRRRKEFWGLSAFLSRTNLVRLNSDSYGQRARFMLADRPTGAYSSVVDPNNPGPRPPRSGGPYAPVYLFGGDTPRNESWRTELARILTSDRQFARATVNYLWAALFTYGIVDPADGWDLARVDPAQPLPDGWPSQNANPQLLEQLTDYFISRNYSIREVIRLIVNSNTYQLSGRYPDGAWKPGYTRYFAKRFPRRLSAEERWDAVAAATLTETPMQVQGFDQPLLYANQLPDPTEPRGEWTTLNDLATFGRGDWLGSPKDTNPSLLQLLYLMNDWSVVQRTRPTSNGWSVSNRVLRLAVSDLTDEEVIQEIFLATLSRRPSADELKTAMAARRRERVEWLSDLQWALMNKLDFIFNY